RPDRVFFNLSKIKFCSDTSVKSLARSPFFTRRPPSRLLYLGHLISLDCISIEIFLSKPATSKSSLTINSGKRTAIILVPSSVLPSPTPSTAVDPCRRFQSRSQSWACDPADLHCFRRKLRSRASTRPPVRRRRPHSGAIRGLADFTHRLYRLSPNIMLDSREHLNVINQLNLSSEH
ncbi:Unknown protein, partial [Striga hermonthica]